MGMGNFTGLDPSVALTNINDFEQRGNQCWSDLKKVFTDFFSDLSQNWGSPKAVDFYGNYGESAASMISETLADLCIVAQKAADAYNKIATANGVPTISRVYYEPAMGDQWVVLPELKDTLPNGVGMYVENVKNLLSEFKININNVRSSLDALPNVIALYDASNAQSDAFYATVGNLKTKINNKVDEIVNTLEKNIENEVNLTEQGAQSSASTLNG